MVYDKEMNMRSIENRLLLKGRKNKNARPMVACKARTIITILLAVIVVSGRAQTSFDTGDGCLNVIDISYAQGIGE